jgi:hypothetical protein
VTPLAEALAEIRQVREWLLRPSADTLDACGPALERAAAQVSGLLQAPLPSDPSLRPAVLELAHEVLQAQALLAAAGQLYFGRLQRLSEAATA